MTYRHLEFFLHNHIDPRIKLVYICGADLAHDQLLYRGGHTMPIAVVGRHEYSEKLKCAIESLQKERVEANREVSDSEFEFIDVDMENISSTLVRDRLQRQESIADIVPAGAQEYLVRKRLV